MSDHTDRDEDVVLGDEVKVRRRTGTALVAVRVQAELLARIQAYAQARGLTVSDVLRMGAEQLTGQGPTTAYTYTVRTVDSIRRLDEQFTKGQAISVVK